MFVQGPSFPFSSLFSRHATHTHSTAAPHLLLSLSSLLLLPLPPTLKRPSPSLVLFVFSHRIRNFPLLSLLSSVPPLSPPHETRTHKKSCYLNNVARTNTKAHALMETAARPRPRPGGPANLSQVQGERSESGKRARGLAPFSSPSRPFPYIHSLPPQIKSTQAKEAKPKSLQVNPPIPTPSSPLPKSINPARS